MTAIFGITQHDQSPIPPESLQSAADSLRHHAEHGLKIWQDDGIALGQALTRFWNHSPQTATPERDQERGLTLVADARLDNRAELANRLGISQVDLPNIPDNRLLLRAYAAWGPECPRYLLGDFVFAVWEERSNRLFLARDPIGIRWLYYFAGPRRFAFASDLAGLLDLMDEAPHIDPRSLNDYFIFPYNLPSEKTFYQNAHKLQPGQALLLENGQTRAWNYWNAAEIGPNPALRDPREGVEILRGLLRESVASRAETVDRLGSHLSGGLDSSAITALAVSFSRQTDRPDPLAFSWSPPLEMRPMMDMDERIHVQRVAEHLRIPVTYTHVPPQADVLHEVSDPSTLPLNTVRFEQTVMENARQQGARVLLSGWGGDELIFSRGIGYPSGLIKQGRLLALARYLKYQYGWRPKRWVGGLYTHGIYPLLPPNLQRRLPLTLRQPHQTQKQAAIQKILEQNRYALPAREFCQPDFYRLLESHHQSKFEWIPPGLRACQLWYLNRLLSRIESWAAWSARLGARHAYPLFDQRIVELALSMPEDWIYYGGKSREFGKQATSDALPAKIFEGRDKQDRALAAHQKTIEHKREVRAERLKIFETHQAGNPPAAAWLDFEYLHRVLQEQPITSTTPLPPDFQPLPRTGIWQVLNFAFIDQRAKLPEER